MVNDDNESTMSEEGETLNESNQLDLDTDKDKTKNKAKDKNKDINKVTWSSKQVDRKSEERRDKRDRRAITGRAITVPDMRSGYDRRTGEDRRKVRLTITGRAMDVK